MLFTVLKYVLLSVVGIFAIVLLGFHIGSGKPVRSIALNTCIGFAGVLLLNLTSKFTGVYLPINIGTVVGVGYFGLPAVCMLLFLNVIFGLVL